MFINKSKLEFFQGAHRKHTYVPNKLFHQKVKHFVFNVVFPVGTNRNGNLQLQRPEANVSCEAYFFSAVSNERFRGIGDLNTHCNWNP